MNEGLEGLGETGRPERQEGSCHLRVGVVLLLKSDDRVGIRRKREGSVH